MCLAICTTCACHLVIPISEESLFVDAYVARFLARERVTKESERLLFIILHRFSNYPVLSSKKTPLCLHHAQTASETVQQSTIPAIHKHRDPWYDFKQSCCILILPTAIYIVTYMAFTYSNCAITQYTQLHSLISLCSCKNKLIQTLSCFIFC